MLRRPNPEPPSSTLPTDLAPGSPAAAEASSIRPGRRRRRPSWLAAVLTAGLALAAGACGGDEGMGETAAGTAAEPAPAAAETPNGPPAGAPIGPLTSSGEPAAAPAMPPAGGAAAGAAGRLAFSLPEGWTEVPPASPMRMAQATIPGPGGPADLVLFHFGVGGGGGVDANIDRWIGQMEVEGEPERGSFDANGLRVTWVDVGGTLLPSGMGMGPTEPQPGSRLLGAVVEGPGGPWFFKATGPDETLAAAREDFLGMLRAAQVE